MGVSPGVTVLLPMRVLPGDISAWDSQRLLKALSEML